MKGTTLRKVTRCGLYLIACLVLVLLATAAAKAQQEVDPERFDKSSSTRQVKPAVSHRKSNKSTRKRQPQKPVTASANSDSQKRQIGRGAQQVVR